MFPNGQRHRGAECAAIVMETRAFDFEALAVQPKACRWIEMELANPETNVLLIDGLSVCPNFRHGPIQRSIANVPQLRIGHDRLYFECGSLIWREDYWRALFFSGGNWLSVGRQYIEVQRDITRKPRL